MATKHITDKEVKFVAVNTSPDVCIVGGVPVPFDISRTLDHAVVHSNNVRARGHWVLRIGDVVAGVDGDAGSGIISGTSQGAGDVIFKTGANSVRANKIIVCRHQCRVEMN
ncbi:MAG: DUF4150 domain-containing protein [Polyangiaceae bacterium]|nr:DUF4150 domain-containing protein [Polyangiaceae bacterium]